MKVKIRYANTSLFEGSWEDAPAYEVQTICYQDPTGQITIRHGGDYYKLEDGEVIPKDRIGLITEAVVCGFDPTEHRHPEIALLNFAAQDMGWKIGSFVGPEKWTRIHTLGVIDRDTWRAEVS